MWDFGSRDIVALASAFTGCVFLYNVWGPILILTVSLFLTVYACYSLIINDSLLSPHACLLLDYCRHICADIRVNFQGIVDHAYEYIRRVLLATKRRVQKQYLTLSRMERRRGSHYQLSSDSYSNRREPSDSKNRFQRSSHGSLYDRGSFDKHTSTPIYPRRREEFENQTFDLSLPGQTLGKGMSSPRSQSADLFRQQNAMYLAAPSPSWGIRAASKGEEKFAEERSTDTHSGPLSSSTRYNMDPKIYNDVTSPGLTSRLTKYAAEASNKLTHQSQYRVGQFPKVNLHASPVPLLNAKSVKTRTPVTVRVAPPDAVRYSPPSRQKRFTDLHRSINDYTSPSVAQALKDISLKRQASRENIVSDLAKKQRTDGLARKEAEMQDETKQKRGREESLKSEEETSPQSKSARPAKRTKTPSCYDIINSLSSSKHVVSGVKRKARDFSRSGTPDFEKHFKSVECGQTGDTHTVQQVQGTSPKQHHHHHHHHHHRRYEKMTGRNSNSSACNCTEKVQQEDSPLRGILKSNDKIEEAVSEDRYLCRKEPKTQGGEKDRAGPAESARLAQKLFMKAEPERNEKLHMLVEEQGNIRAKFTTDDVEEIKKEDIADMRQTSMKARLQSMFDAISGKAASRINPDVVIQAEEVSNAVESVESVACPVTCATLNSSTVTTNVNTAPISTSAVAPSPRTSESNVKSPKHVAFNLPEKESSSNTNAQQFIDSSRLKSENGPPSATSSTTGVSVPSFTPSSTTSAAPASTNTNGQTVEFDKSTFATSSTNGTIGNKCSGFAVSTTANTLQKVATATSIPSTSSPNAKMTLANVSQAASIVSPNTNLTMGGSSRMFATLNANAARLTTPTVPESKAGGAAAGSVPPVCLGNAKAETSATSMKISASNALPTGPTGPTGPTSATNTGTSSTPLFMFRNGSSGPAKNTKPDAVFAFGSPAANAPQFGSSTTLQPITTAVGPGVQINPAPSTTATGTFGQIGKTTSSGFGSSASSTFTFRGAAATTAADGKASFSFGNTSNAPIAPNAPAAASNVAVFTGGKPAGTMTSFAAQSAPVSASSGGSSTGQFGSNAASMFASSTTAPSIFGATATGSQAIFGASSSNSNRGATSATSATSAPAFPLPKTTPAVAFGSNVPATSANSVPLFSNAGNAPAPGTTSAASMSVFGSNASTAVQGKSGNVTTSGGLFSGASLSTTPSSAFAAPSSIFGQGNPPAVGANSRNDTGVFGSNSGSTLFGSQANPLTTFDAAKAPASSANAAFGSSNISPSNGTVPSFGTASTTASGFGSQPKTEPGVQAAGSQPFAIGTSIFGTENTAAASFGRVASTGGAGPFGTPTTSNAFAGQSSNSTFGGSGSLAGAFGDGNKASPFGGQTTAFGPANASSPAAFGSGGNGGGSGGNANNENNSSAGIFTFGGNQKPAPPQTSTFSFGSNNNAGNNAAGGGSAPFQFGTTTSSGPGTGFNFSAPPATPSINFGTTNAPPTFNASTPGMFSIGSGSNAPRSRSMRTRKPR